MLLLGRFIIAHTSVKSISIDFGKLMSIAKEINKKKLEIANALAHSVRWCLPSTVHVKFILSCILTDFVGFRI